MLPIVAYVGLDNILMIKEKPEKITYTYSFYTNNIYALAMF